ncbi:MAG: hypothetical protein JXB08_03690 [Bacilli bacterium]|nr:hypothetical protein [Bacilli bacterium]MBN2876279.1 hypothetical protein [Bacilli bacterium]
MTIKDVLENERKELQSVKRPYESVAFLITAVLFFQQFFYLVLNFYNFAKSSGGWFSSANFTNANLQGFIVRIVNIDNSSWIIVILAILAWLFYYAAIFLLVWNYARKQKLAKWTWTLFVAFGPTILFVPAYIWFVIYAYRSYLVRFAKRVVTEFKEFNPEQKFPEEQE